MAIKKEEINGTKIINEIESSNIVRTQYDTADKKMICEFKTGVAYEYEDVPHSVYTQFRLSESQGKFFNSEISRKFKFKKVE